MDKSALFGLLSGLTVVVLTMVAVALVNLPEAEGAVTRAADCHRAQVPQDQGYEISSKVTRTVCESTAP